MSDQEQLQEDEGPVGAGDEGPIEVNDELRSPFPHPDWTVGLVLVAGVITLLFGILVRPIWLVVGSPFLIALGLWLYVKLLVAGSEPRA